MLSSALAPQEAGVPVSTGYYATDSVTPLNLDSFAALMSGGHSGWEPLSEADRKIAAIASEVVPPHSRKTGRPRSTAVRVIIDWAFAPHTFFITQEWSGSAPDDFKLPSPCLGTPGFSLHCQTTVAYIRLDQAPSCNTPQNTATIPAYIYIQAQSGNEGRID
ncbi:hypothetical protein DFH06DRAFT_1472759 [Mycena polygramma]|nr:hypothetical protein DFH06DRAFT_1472759 [Mycena polygramma]